MVHEAVRIVTDASMNSKTEYVGYKIPRLVVDKSLGESKKDIDSEERTSKWEESEMDSLRNLALAQPANNPCLSYRKRKVETMEKVESDVSPVLKRSKAAACDSVDTPASTTAASVRSGRGKWNPNRRNFTRKSSAGSIVRWLKSQPVESSTPVEKLKWV